MSVKYINEALSLNGKYAFNDGQVAFKTNTVLSILQHLAWQYNDTYVGSIKYIENVKEVQGHQIIENSLNGTPLPFRGLGEHVILNMPAGENIILHMVYMYTDKPELMQYVNPEHVEFAIVINNGSWYFLPKSENLQLFEDLFELNVAYSNIDLPTSKMPKSVPLLNSVQQGKVALRAFARDNDLSEFTISTFTVPEPIILNGYHSLSRKAYFTPDINDFFFENGKSQFEVPANTEIPYIVDEEGGKIIMLVVHSVDHSKWYMVDGAEYSQIRHNAQDFFVDAVKNTVESNRLNAGLKTDDIYQAVAKLRAVSIFNKVQEEFSYSGYYYIQNYSQTLTADKFNKLSINNQGFVNVIMNNKDLVLFKDTIMIYCVNLKSNIVVIAYPNKMHTCYVTTLDQLPELKNEFYGGDSNLDTVVSISDIYFRDNASKKGDK